MLGLIVLVVMGGYLALSIFLVIATYRSMKKKGCTGSKVWMPAVMVGLVMYLLVFWDHVPTMVAHKYYCDKDAGFTVYKTLEEWKIENPGVAETLTFYNDARRNKVSDYDYSLVLNQRFSKFVYTKKVLLGIRKRESKIIDRQNDVVLSRWVDFDTDIMNFALRARSLRDYKFWLSRESCDPGVINVSETEYFKFERAAANIKREL